MWESRVLKVWESRVLKVQMKVHARVKKHTRAKNLRKNQKACVSHELKVPRVGVRVCVGVKGPKNVGMNPHGS